MKLDLRVAFSKLLGGIVALGIGLPLGREGPTVQLGAAMAAVVGGVGYQSPRHRRQLIAAGAGAGLAAAFNAPLAGVMFVVEELLKEVSGEAIGSALLACFFAGIVARYLGNHTLDVGPNSQFPQAVFSLQDLPFLLLLGLAAAAVGSMFNEALLKVTKWHDRIFGNKYVLRVALAGLICGTVIALLPSSFRDFAGIRQLIFEDRTWRFASVALVSNFALTALAYGSGAPGGLFAPSLTIGAALGYLIGLSELVFFPGASQSLTTLSLVGMGAVFTAVARVPITATVIVFEMTADFNILLPLMVCSIVAQMAAEKLSPGSVYDRLLEQKGIFLTESEDTDPLSRIVVTEVMRRDPESVVSNMTLTDLLEKFETSQHRGFPVIEDGRLAGIITQTDVTSKRSMLAENATVKDLMTPATVCARASDNLKHVIGVLDEHGLSRLPVVEEDGRLIGIITRTNVISALAKHYGE
jgi:CIC family chloride channel protein